MLAVCAIANLIFPELFCFGEAQTNEADYAVIFGCAQTAFPIRYLGIPIYYRRLMIAKWRQVEERIQKRLTSQKGKYLSTG